MAKSKPSPAKIAKHRARTERAAIGLADALSKLLGRDVQIEAHPCATPQNGSGAELVFCPGVSLRLDDVEAIVAKLGMGA